MRAIAAGRQAAEALARKRGWCIFGMIAFAVLAVGFKIAALRI